MLEENHNEKEAHIIKQRLEKAEYRTMQKNKIRNAISEAHQVEVLPATKNKVLETEQNLRVAAYCRVSTFDAMQASSYELQVQHYTEYIGRQKNWVCVGVYADEGISGTSVKNRSAFLQMIKDCEDGKIDLIITKSVSRFSRNLLDSISYVRRLKALKPPVEVRFENHGLNTLDKYAELQLALLASVAQSESEAKSEAITWAFRQRSLLGLPLIPTWAFLGYDKDKDGNLFIVKEEAQIVRFIYRRFLSGKTTRQIAQSLTDAGIPTVKNRMKGEGGGIWPAETVRSILKNEKYCGDVVMQKTFTPDFLTHKRVRNNGEEIRYYVADHHPPIISREKWNLVQEQLKYRRYSRDHPRKPLRIRRMPGALGAFYILNPNWDGYDLARVQKELFPLPSPEENNEMRIIECKALI